MHLGPRMNGPDGILALVPVPGGLGTCTQTRKMLVTARSRIQARAHLIPGKDVVPAIRYQYTKEFPTQSHSKSTEKSSQEVPP